MVTFTPGGMRHDEESVAVTLATEAVVRVMEAIGQVTVPAMVIAELTGKLAASVPAPTVGVKVTGVLIAVVAVPSVP